jgi:hypothetical protein
MPTASHRDLASGKRFFSSFEGKKEEGPWGGRKVKGDQVLGKLVLPLFKDK